MSETLTVTIKYPGKDKPWLVAHAEDVSHARSILAEAFGLQNTDSLTLHEVIVLAQRQAEAVNILVKEFGATPIPDSGSEGVADSPEAEPERHPLLDSLDNCTTAPEVKTLWAKNREAFDADADLTAAMKARYKELNK